MMPETPTELECDNMRTTIYTILNSLPCTECKLHSLRWFNERISKHNSRRIVLDKRDKWIYEVWHQHDVVNEKVVLLNPHMKKGISWPEYRKQLEINRITCKIHHE
jgi:hypothetical protein